jgi:hypothetical protein
VARELRALRVCDAPARPVVRVRAATRWRRTRATFGMTRQLLRLT